MVMICKTATDLVVLAQESKQPLWTGDGAQFAKGLKT